jgi:hypothetical protein
VPVRGGQVQRGQRALALDEALATGLAVEAEALEPCDLPLTFQARGMIRGQVGDQRRDPVAQLQGEVGGGGAHQLAHVLDAHLPGALLARKAARVLGLAHSPWAEDARSACAADSSPLCLLGTIWSRESSSVWVTGEIICSSPISQP